jgi:hypothetical protein
MMKEWKVFALLFAVVLVAGCTSLTNLTSGGSNGLAMTMTLSDSSVDPGTQVQLSVLLQNNGGSKATGITTQLNGLTQDWGISPGTSISIQDLAGIDTSHGVTKGEADEEFWTLTGPGLSTQISYPFSLKVTYNYHTLDNVVLRAVSSEYSKTHKITTGKLSESSTSGPVTISLSTTSTIFSGNSIAFYLNFNNAGSGVVKDNTLNVNVQGNGVSCSKSTLKLIPDSTGVGRNGMLRCTASTAGGGDYPQFVISVDASYTYQIEQTGSITVLAKTS